MHRSRCEGRTSHRKDCQPRYTTHQKAVAGLSRPSKVCPFRLTPRGYRAVRGYRAAHTGFSGWVYRCRSFPAVRGAPADASRPPQIGSRPGSRRISHCQGLNPQHETTRRCFRGSVAGIVCRSFPAVITLGREAPGFRILPSQARVTPRLGSAWGYRASAVIPTARF